MKNMIIGAMLTAIGVAIGGNVMAQDMTRDEYKLQGDKIDSAFKSDKESCLALTGNPKDICVEKAKARQKLAEAQLEAAYKPTAKNQNEIAVVKAEGEYHVAMEMCDDKAGNAKDTCVAEAKAEKARALAAAKPAVDK